MQYIDDMPATTSFATKDLSQTCGETPPFQDTRIHGRTHMIHLRFVDSNLFSHQLKASHALLTVPALAGCCRHSERCYVRCSHTQGPFCKQGICLSEAYHHAFLQVPPLVKLVFLLTQTALSFQ